MVLKQKLARVKFLLIGMLLETGTMLVIVIRVPDSNVVVNVKPLMGCSS